MIGNPNFIQDLSKHYDNIDITSSEIIKKEIDDKNIEIEQKDEKISEFEDEKHKDNIMIKKLKKELEYLNNLNNNNDNNNAEQLKLQKEFDILQEENDTFKTQAEKDLANFKNKNRILQEKFDKQHIELLQLENENEKLANKAI